MGKYIPLYIHSKVRNLASSRHTNKKSIKLDRCYMFSIGSIQILWAGDIGVVKDIGLCISQNLGKPSYIAKERGALVGQGIASSGPLWSHQRKIIAPEFYMDKVNDMLSLMVDCTTSMLRAWEIRIENEGGIEDINN